MLRNKVSYIIVDDKNCFACCSTFEGYYFSDCILNHEMLEYDSPDKAKQIIKEELKHYYNENTLRIVKYTSSFENVVI